jgi:hypothetical protein
LLHERGDRMNRSGFEHESAIVQAAKLSGDEHKKKRHSARSLKLILNSNQNFRSWRQFFAL